MIKILAPFLIYFAILIATSVAQPRPPLPSLSNSSARIERAVKIKMRDGVHLSTDLYFPQAATGKLPAILVRTPYGKNESSMASVTTGALFLTHGYIFVVQDLRGRYESEGEYAYLDDRTGADGYDTLSWLVEQPWSNGKVGTFGCSASGDVQVELARLRHPNHAAMIAQGCYLGPNMGMREGGAVNFMDWAIFFRLFGGKESPVSPLPKLDFGPALRSLPVVDVARKLGKTDTEWEAIVSHQPKDAWWNRFGPILDTDRFDVPAIHMTSWFDTSTPDVLDLYNLFVRRSISATASANQFLIVGPRTHCNFNASEHTLVGDRAVGDARLDTQDLYVRWFDRWLKNVDNGVTRMSKVQAYSIGVGRWLQEAAWPPPGQRTLRYYLHSDGHANSRFGSGVLTSEAPGEEPPDTYVYDPRTPVPTVGGRSFAASLSGIRSGAIDQSDLETRHDVLVYSTPPLTKGVQVAGPVDLILYVSSSARDTDFTAKLVDVYPDGAAYNVQDTILRARYREGYEKEVWMDANNTYRIKLTLRSTANYFATGHRIRLEVSSSNFPFFDRNLNTGGNNYGETQWIVARNTIHHRSASASHLMLSVLP
jgi:uncharacterized protein